MTIANRSYIVEREALVPVAAAMTDFEVPDARSGRRGYLWNLVFTAKMTDMAKGIVSKYAELEATGVTT